MRNSLTRSAILAALAVAAPLSVAQLGTPVQVIASDPGANRYFGNSVAISGDVMVVGGPLLNGAVANTDGSVYVFRWNGTTWVQEQKIPGPTAGSGTATEFGRTVAISGDTIVVGARGDDQAATDAGAAWVYNRVGGLWTFQAKLVAGDAAASDFFGEGVAIDGDTIVVAAPSDDNAGGTDAGSAYVFVRNGTTWTQQQKLLASTGAANDFFGQGPITGTAGSVTISGDTIAVGAPSKGANAGRVFLYNRRVAAGTVWVEDTNFTSPDIGTDTAPRFGASVSLRGDVLAVGATTSDIGGTDRGSTYIFRRTNNTWSTAGTRLAAADAANNDLAGFSVSLGNDTVLIGATQRTINANSNAGIAFAFRFKDGVWTQEAVLTSPDAAAGDFFGWSVALDGDLAAIGAQSDDLTSPAAFTDAGSAWIFSRAGTKWIQNDPSLSRPITPNVNVPAVGDLFGVAAAIDGDTIVAGAFQDTEGGGAQQGSAYVMVRNGQQFTEQAKLTATGAAAGDFFGRAVAVQGDTAVIGAIGRDVSGKVDQGAAYVFTRSGVTWTQQQGLTASDGLAGDNYGLSVAVGGDWAAVGAPNADVGAAVNSGAVYLYLRTSGTWTQITKLTQESPATNDNFGFAASMTNDVLVVGAYRRTVGANANQGAAYVYVREGGSWRFLQQLTANDGQAQDLFGVSVHNSGDLIIVGAIGKSSSAGAAYIFARQANGNFSQAARIVANDGRKDEIFGYAVAISGNNAFVGAPFVDLANANDAGVFYGFTSATGTPSGPWVQTKKYARNASPIGNDLVGFTASMSGFTAVIGGYNFNGTRGAVWVVDQPDVTTITAVNQTSQQQALTLDSVLATASDGQIVVGSAGAFNATNVDFAGRRVSARSLSSIAMNSSSLLSMSDKASLVAGPGAAINLFGTTRTLNDEGRSDITGGSIRQTGSGSLFVGKHELSMNSLSNNLGGRVTLQDAGAAISATGPLAFTGTLTDLFGGRLSSASGVSLDGVVNLRNTTISAGGPISISTLATLTGVNMAGPAINVTTGGTLIGSGTWLGAMRVSGKVITSAATNVQGSLIIDANASVNYNGGALTVFGAFTNNGTINPAGNPGGCPNCVLLPTQLWVENDLTLAAASSYNMAGTANIGGRFDNAIDNALRFNGRSGTVQMDGRAGVHTFEVMSRDYGNAGAATRNYVPGSFPLYELRLGDIPVTVNLVNLHNNANAGKEVVYLDSLVIPAGSRLNTNGYTVYTRSASIAGSVDNLNNIRALGAPCAADLAIDGIVADSDFELFVGAYNFTFCSEEGMAAASGALPGGCPADLNADGLVDDEDFQIFAAAYDRLLCD
ncbi:MAG: FG-GAP repeat protein [Phycisphaerales bacterium]|nr:FG-GAP repeat protein [Phycisphaerales bacterium]